MAIELPGAARFNEVKLDSLIEPASASPSSGGGSAHQERRGKGDSVRPASPELAPVTPD
jgi:hypothetical protein